MSIKVVVDIDLCQGHSVCVGECPEVFDVIEQEGDYPQVLVLQEQPPAELRKKIETAARYCPNHVISIIEE